MPRPRFTNLDPERRARLIDTAGREFAAHGFEGASLNGILEAAGFSKGSFYYHFEDKLDLFATVFADLEARVTREMPLDLEGLDADSFWPGLRRYAEAFLAIAEDLPWLVGLGRAYYALPEARRREGALGDYLEGHSRWLEAFVQRGQALGAIRRDLPAELLVRLFLAVDEVLDRWAIERWDVTSAAEMRRILDVSLEILRRIAAPKEDP